MIRGVSWLSLFISIGPAFLLTPSTALSQETASDIWAPWVTKTTETSATVNWRGEKDGAGLVDFATSRYYDTHKGFEKTVFALDPGTFQHVLLTGLEPGTPYVYRVRPLGSTPAFGNRAFRTMPVSKPGVSLALMTCSERVSAHRTGQGKGGSRLFRPVPS